MHHTYPSGLCVCMLRGEQTWVNGSPPMEILPVWFTHFRTWETCWAAYLLIIGASGANKIFFFLLQYLSTGDPPSASPTQPPHICSSYSAMATHERHQHGQQSTQPDASYLVAGVQLRNDLRHPFHELQPTQSSKDTTYLLYCG